MKVLIAVVAVAALGAVGGALYVGATLKEPTVVADPYQAGLHYDEHRHGARASDSPKPPACDLQSGPCSQHLPGGGEVLLSVEPRPVRTMRDLEFTVTITPAAAAGGDVALALSMPGMYMGETRSRLARVADGVFRGKGVLVRCPSGRRDWSAEVVVENGGAAMKPPAPPSPPLAPGQPSPAAPALATSGERTPRTIARFSLTVAE